MRIHLPQDKSSTIHKDELEAMSRNDFHKVSHQKDEEEKQNVEKDASCDAIFKVNAEKQSPFINMYMLTTTCWRTRTRLYRSPKGRKQMV